MFGSLGIGICGLFVIWCLKFVIFSNFILSELVSHLSGNVETFSYLSLTAMPPPRPSITGARRGYGLLRLSRRPDKITTAAGRIFRLPYIHSRFDANSCEAEPDPEKIIYLPKITGFINIAKFFKDPLKKSYWGTTV
jgi:hypothetical protein